MNVHEEFLENLSKKSGLSIFQIKEKSPTELREYLTKKNKKPLQIKPQFPFIGRGCTIREFATTEDIERELDSVLNS